ncbi:hypothetical protein CTAM01_14505 [Colletotrichum tamarilloi]|uniref:Uncharacterized protein n=1 Tax=Colletotrichum tamarilloi TaxID=1209934 RepID=A0ABQ9QNX9_9PEZI|nr:uncharacterized protein CTAM01_14505 [Colletotrichum tamarilloi]KAK1479758.1 hypothetical protein CTAM01_14505 [Colletotrichum tamarilloi]
MADATGNTVTNQQAVTNFIIAITTRFAPPSSPTTVASSGNGLPTPENPFVLGYGISQVDPKPLPQTPQFDPQNFQFSVSHQPNGYGTLNFLMLLGPITPLTNVTQNGNAGVFAVPFLKSIGADAPSPAGGPQYDGTLAVSAKAFRDQYIVKQLQDFFAIPKPTLKDVTVHTDSNATNFTSFNSFATNNTWHTDTSGSDVDYFNYNGSWNNTVSITSNYAGQQMPVDAARTLSISAVASFWIKYLQTVEASWKYLNPYSGTLSAETTVTPINLAYNVATGSKGGWTFSVDGDKTKLPPMEDDPDNPGQKRLVLKEENASGNGLEVIINKTGSFFSRGIFNPTALMNEMTNGLAPVARSVWAMYQAQLSNSLSSLNSQIVMPVGNVFTFNGLSLDSQGNLLTLMKYQTQSGDGEITNV